MSTRVIDNSNSPYDFVKVKGEWHRKLRGTKWWVPYSDWGIEYGKTRVLDGKVG